MLQWLHIKKKSNTIFKRRTFESRFSTRSCWAITTTIIIEAPLIIENIRLCFSLDMHIKGTFLNSINFIANSLSLLFRTASRSFKCLSLYFICIIQIKKMIYESLNISIKYTAFFKKLHLTTGKNDIWLHSLTSNKKCVVLIICTICIKSA